MQCLGQMSNIILQQLSRDRGCATMETSTVLQRERAEKSEGQFGPGRKPQLSMSYGRRYNSLAVEYLG